MWPLIAAYIQIVRGETSDEVRAIRVNGPREHRPEPSELSLCLTDHPAHLEAARKP